MSIELMSLVLHHSVAHPTQKLILLGIANHQGDGGAWPSIDTLATYANVSRRSVSTALQALEKRGDIIIEPQAGRNRTNLYWVTLDCPTECDRSMNHRLKSDQEQNYKHAVFDIEACSSTSNSMKPTSYKPYITIKNTKEILERKKDAERQHAAELDRMFQQARENATDMPTCKHDIPLLRCIECCKALAKETTQQEARA